jgi:hypothetical protein
MNKVRFRLDALRVAGIVCFLGSLAIGVAIFRAKSMNEEWQKRSDVFAEQLNSLGTELEPGGVGVIEVPASAADELILLGYGCTRNDLWARFPDRRASFIEDLLRISRDKHTCPALLWLRNGRVISRNGVTIKVGANISVQSWTLQGRRQIKVAKELESPNGFLSVSLLEEQK